MNGHANGGPTLDPLLKNMVLFDWKLNQKPLILTFGHILTT